jgi:hypothetical protein
MSTIERPTDWPVTRPPEHSPDNIDESQAAIELMDAAIAARLPGEKVEVVVGDRLMSLGHYLASPEFNALKMDKEVRAGIVAKYGSLARGYDTLPIPGPSVPLFDDEFMKSAAKAGANINGDQMAAGLGHEAMHGSRPADPKERAAGDYERE